MDQHPGAFTAAVYVTRRGTRDWSGQAKSRTCYQVGSTSAVMGTQGFSLSPRVSRDRNHLHQDKAFFQVPYQMKARVNVDRKLRGLRCIPVSELQLSHVERGWGRDLEPKMGLTNGVSMVQTHGITRTMARAGIQVSQSKVWLIGSRENGMDGNRVVSISDSSENFCYKQEWGDGRSALCSHIPFSALPRFHLMSSTSALLVWDLVLWRRAGWCDSLGSPFITPLLFASWEDNN